MAIRGDISVAFHLAPRIVTVAAPSVALNLQDLHDTLGSIEDSIENHSYDILIDSAGKEDLGGSIFVGITATLQNAQLAAQARTTPAETGTATTGDAAGLLLIDSAATFQTNLVLPGAWVLNCATGASATVLSVDSEIQLAAELLSGGSRADWQIGDDYQVWNVIQFVLSAGNLVAVDGDQLPISAIFTTAFTQFVAAASSSATIAELTTTVARLLDLWQRQGLDPDNPLVVTPTSADAGGVAQVISGDGVTSSTVTRTP